MKYNSPFMLTMYMMIIISTLMIITSPNWLTAWIMLEINMLSFIPIMKYSKSNQETEASIKYFMAQALGSLLLLLSSSMMNQNELYTTSMITMIMALSMKLGAFPCHYWYPPVMAALSWINCLILSTWQKLAPILLMCFMSSPTNPNNLLIIFAASNSIIGGIMGMNQTHLRQLLAFSSIGHLGWMISMISINKTVICLIYFTIYSILVIPIFMIMHSTNMLSMKNMNNMSKSNMFYPMMLMILMLSLAGLPPLTGFMPKLMVIQYMMSYNHFLLLMLLTGSLMNLYYYLNISLSSIMSMTTMYKHHSSSSQPSIKLISSVLSLSMIGMIPMLI